MRYRPFGRSGVSISVLTLNLSRELLSQGPDVMRTTVFSALENGVNSFRLETADPVLAELAGDALASVDRKLVSVSLLLGGGRGAPRDFSAEGLTRSIEEVLHVSGLGWIDVGVLDAPSEEELPQAALTTLKQMRSAQRLKQLGVAGCDDAMDAYISTGAFDLVAMPYHVNSPWQTKSRIRAALERDMAVMAYGYFPDSLDTARKAAGVNAEKQSGWKALLGGRKPIAREAGTFAFLHQTTGWAAEEICLAYALTDPSICSVIIDADRGQRVEALSATTERDLPPGTPAQIEMARVGRAAAA
ncbi:MULTISPECIES: aldo/keto reductase [Brevundimonas]|uniref:aldo/keto reductase n=1 Tax=Brevundimonas TaxID=41275 RepID=UPI000F042FFC|nr:aldo/keto reductase [Brevundimonas lutea]